MPPGTLSVPFGVGGFSLGREAVNSSVLHSFLVSDDAAAATEYAAMLALIVLAAAGVLSGLGASVGTTFASLDSGVTAVIP